MPSAGSNVFVARIFLWKQGAKLCKMINPKSKKMWYPSLPFDGSLPSLKSLTKIEKEPGKRGLRRVAMLNKMFMKNITDILSTGTVAMDVVGRGIEISKVNVSQDFSTVKVYWVCKGSQSDDEIEEVLKRVAGPLRHELSTLRIMGEIPYVVFSKDLNETHIVELDRRLAIADYGEDYTPTDLGHLLKTEFSLDTKLSAEMKAKIKTLEESQPLEEELIPEMTHNVFGLEHDKILNRMLAARKKSRDAWNNLENQPVDSTVDSTVISYHRTNSQKESSADMIAQKQELADFLMKRQIEQKKLHKRLNDNRLGLLNADQNDEEHYEEDDFDEDFEEDFEYEELIEKNRKDHY